MTISNAIAEAIAKSMLPIRFATSVQIMRDQEALLAQKVYEHRWSAEHRALMETLPDHWLDLAYTLNAVTNHGKFNLSFVGGAIFNHFAGPDAVYRRWPMASRHEKANVSIQDPDLAADVLKYAQAAEDLRARIREAFDAAEKAIKASGSLKKLVQVWPEVAPYAAKYMGVVKPQLPAVRVDVLNAMLGLPAEVS